MKVLGTENSSPVVSVALTTDDILTAEHIVDFRKTHPQTLFLMPDKVAKPLELDMDIIDVIAVAGGSGFFTGLRIGAATTKGPGLALKKPLVHAPIADAVAYNTLGAEELIRPIMDAKRGQAYTGLHHIRGGLEVVLKQQPMDTRELVGFLNEKGEWVISLGDGVLVYKDVIREMLTVFHTSALAQMNRQKAASVTAPGMSMILDVEDCHGVQVVTAAELMPGYLRKSQTEHRREAEQFARGVAAKPPGDY